MKRQHKTDIYGVIGLGRFGTALVKTLAEAGKEVIAIDKNEEKVKAVRRYTDYAFVVDNLSEEAIKETGMQNCGTVTVCIGEQVDISILTTMLVVKLGVPQVIAKAASEVHGEVLKRLGATVVYPEADMAVGGACLGDGDRAGVEIQIPLAKRLPGGYVGVAVQQDITGLQRRQVRGVVHMAVGGIN